jgi:16S rRNA (adenine1518-N6/adenine1519-N6)-dimethyltransferase
MTLPRLDLHSLLKKFNIRPKKSLGQNFLWDANILDRIVQAADLNKHDHVLEIGAGIGTLTRHLSASAQHVVAVEIDRTMKPILQEVLEGKTNVSIVMEDMLSLDPADLGLKSGYLVIANIPYYITSSLIRHLFESQMKPSRMVLTVQQEVARRICAAPGKLSLLALSVQIYGQPRIVMKIPAGAFYPVPKVDSAVLRVDVYEQSIIPPKHIDLFFKLAKAGFMQKRKKLRNSLSIGMNIPVETAENRLVLAGIDPANRAQALDFQDWSRLVTVWEGST